MEAVSKTFLKLNYYIKLWRLNLDLKLVSEASSDPLWCILQVPPM